MKLEYKLIALLLFFALFYVNCGPTGISTNYNSIYSFTPVPGVVGGNSVSLTVGAAYSNSLTATVQLCVSASTTCDNVELLVDTGSTGIRVFKSALLSTSAALSYNTDSYGNKMGSCVVYGDSTYHWGPVMTADVVIASEAKTSMPIQVIDYTFGDAGSGCRAAAGTSVNSEVASTHYKGILGIKYFKQDCGSACLTNASNTNPSYYGCTSASGGVCGVIAVPLATQIPNPAYSLAGDNNGYLIDLPEITSTTGTTGVMGSLILGVGTQTNNTPAFTVTRLSAESSYGTIATIFNGTTYTAIVDTGSNGNFFSYSGVSTCTAPYASWFCPTSQTTLSVKAMGATGNAYVMSSVLVGNGATLMGGTNTAFNNLSGPISIGLSGYFDYGLSFFFGKKIYFGMEGMATSIGNGPYVAF